jgi:site-specific recombinase XerD
MVNWRSSLQRLDGAFSDHTLRSYRSGFEAFSQWCRRCRKTALPAASETVADYIEEEAGRLKPATLKQRLCAIRKIHRLCEHGDPTDDENVELAMRRARRSQRDQLLLACSDDLIGLRDKVLMSVGFDTLCRRGELVAISIEDLAPNGQGQYSVLVRRAKNDLEGAGRISHLSTQSSLLVDQWLTATGAKSGPLLRPVYFSRAPALYLEPLTVSRVLKKLAARADVDPKLVHKVSGHSLRVGAAQQLTLEGRGILQIMRVGGWRSMNVVARYVENMDIDVWS